MSAAKDARINTALPSHPKTKKLLRVLGAEGGWYLVRLFLWATENRSDGDLSGMADDDVELAIDWPGDVGAFVTQLASVGFVDGEAGCRRIHDWDEHNPWAAGAKERSTKAKWNAAKRHHGEAAADRLVPGYRASSTASSTTTAMHIAASSNAPSPSPSPLPSKRLAPDGDIFSGVSPQVIADFKALRKTKKAAITETAMAGIRREASKAGLSLEAALAMCCERGWQSFKAEWVNGSDNATVHQAASLPRLQA